jgi:hypothetical protein
MLKFKVNVGDRGSVGVSQGGNLLSVQRSDSPAQSLFSSFGVSAPRADGSVLPASSGDGSNDFGPLGFNGEDSEWVSMAASIDNGNQKELLSELDLPQWANEKQQQQPIKKISPVVKPKTKKRAPPATAAEPASSNKQPASPVRERVASSPPSPDPVTLTQSPSSSFSLEPPQQQQQQQFQSAKSARNRNNNAKRQNNSNKNNSSSSFSGSQQAVSGNNNKKKSRSRSGSSRESKKKEKAQRKPQQQQYEQQQYEPQQPQQQQQQQKVVGLPDRVAPVATSSRDTVKLSAHDLRRLLEISNRRLGEQIVTYLTSPTLFNAHGLREKLAELENQAVNEFFNSERFKSARR